MCRAAVLQFLLLSAARSAYGRRHGKAVHYELKDVQFIPNFTGDSLEDDMMDEASMYPVLLFPRGVCSMID